MPINLSKLCSAELEGVKAKMITVEVDINVGLHSFTIVGLADKALSEAKERVNAALKNSGFRPPNRENRRITVNLAPADVHKAGSQYDLVIALGYALATDQTRFSNFVKRMIVGELSLDGGVRPIRGALNIASLAREMGFDEIILPSDNSREAALISGIKIIPVKSLMEAVRYLEGSLEIVPKNGENIPLSPEPEIDISEIKGLDSAKRALIVAAAGGHNMLMIGPPGSGKTMLAKAMRSIMPPLDVESSIEISKNWSAAGLLSENVPYLSSRPFRDPHHTSSPAAIIGGGANSRPGEISLAHKGVLFLDELPEFRRDVLESLRQPIESGEITVSRAKTSLRFPARFQLISAMNPCPCGYYGDPDIECRCGAHDILRYQKKISGPLLDRIDIQISVPRVKFEDLRGQSAARSGKEKDVVVSAINFRNERFKKFGIKSPSNSALTSKQCDETIFLSKEAEEFIKKAFDRSHLSSRGYYRLLKVSRTVADMEISELVDIGHVAEAFQYRLRSG